MILRKEMRVELRTREALHLMALFGLLTAALFSATLGLSPAAAQAGPGLLWLVMVFAALLGVPRSFLREREDETLGGLRGAPIGPGAIMAGKVLHNLLLLTLLEAVLFPLFAVFFGYPYPGDPLLAFGVLLLGMAGLVVAASALSALLLHTRTREMLLPVLLAPLLLPLAFASVGALRKVLQGYAADAGREVLLLLVYTGTMTILAWLTAEYVLEE
ncbi:MAG: heme exporter protein CcmB [Euryarchaeota archaeon]|nr:heme exporter protein CcmB [Euryarchaeota archaeon]